MRGKEKEVEWSGVNSGIGSYTFLKLFAYLFLYIVFNFINTIEKMYMDLKNILKNVYGLKRYLNKMRRPKSSYLGESPLLN